MYRFESVLSCYTLSAMSLTSTIKIAVMLATHGPTSYSMQGECWDFFDQTFALDWLKRNARNGGEPSDITIMGGAGRPA
ncbi:hypothetical protein RRG08_052203 [Elysia crispata]|uniref:Uncharacterized protein n=1 Tax=Elysia crispata TaxID=231223 RepID=A0AAE1A0Y2_9GAST|nr:hypothetical protein RRG08_052203 [Elysia crispata]